MSVDGTVVDVAGEPLSGASIHLEDSPCEGLTGDDGRFSVRCTPRRYTVVVSKEGHHTERVHLNAKGRVPHPIPNIELIAQVPNDGLWRYDGATPVGFEAGVIERRSTGRSKAYCLGNDVTPNAVASGRVRLFEQRARPWKLFRLDDQGCAQRLTWRAGSWRVTQSEEPLAVVSTVGLGQLHTFDLPTGDYFLADWDENRFTIDAAQTEATGEKRYSGAHWMVR